MTSAKRKDDLEAVRVVADALEGFDEDTKERILRWARERAGLMPREVVRHPSSPPQKPPPEEHAVGTGVSSSVDIRTFAIEKSAKSDVQFAAIVAYYYSFVAPVAERKEAISADDYVDACRKAGRSRPADASQTLRNAANAGHLDRRDKGAYAINAVGENLVAMVLPGGGSDGADRRRTRAKKISKKKISKRKAGKKKASKKKAGKRKAGKKR